MLQFILILHVLISACIILLVLIQQGKGAGIGAAFGSGASNTVFGSKGSGGFLFKLTGGLALLFFVTSILLTYIASQQSNSQPTGILSGLLTRSSTEESTPAVNNQNKIPQSAGQNSTDSDNNGTAPKGK